MTDLPSNDAYWDVFPKSVRLSLSETPQAIPLSIRGYIDTPVFRSSNPDVINVNDQGVLQSGGTFGNAMIMIWKSIDKKSVRHVAVEVRDPSWFANHPDFRMGDIVHVTGSVVDALSTNGIPNVLVTFRRSETGPVVVQALSDAAGRYQVDLVEGLYVYEATVANYIDAHGLVNVSESGTSGQDIVLSPELQSSSVRIILQWGQYPRDLDAHLRGPFPGGGSFHIYYANDWESGVGELDVDDTSSYGPETITIHSLVPGTYLYCVHDYTNRYVNPSMGLAQSGAMVKVFLQNGQEHTFNVPNSAGTVWNVFEIDGATGAIMPLNTMTHESQPANVGL
jgi:hypothetical protein